MGRKAEETTCNMNDAFGPGVANKYAVQWWFQQFCKGDESLEDEEHSGRLLKLTMTNGKQSSKLILLQLPKRSCQRTQCQPFYVIQHLKQIGKVVSGCLMS